MWSIRRYISHCIQIHNALHTNTQAHKVTISQLHQYTSTRVHKYTIDTELLPVICIRPTMAVVINKLRRYILYCIRTTTMINKVFTLRVGLAQICLPNLSFLQRFKHFAWNYINYDQSLINKMLHFFNALHTLQKIKVALVNCIVFDPQESGDQYMASHLPGSHPTL